MEDIRLAALELIEYELPIIPICPVKHQGMSEKHKATCKSPGKMPLIKGWSQHKETTVQEFNEWYGTWPSMNLGLVLGQTEHWNLVGVDIDGELGFTMFEEVSKNKEVPETWEFYTGSGGYRLLYKMPPNLKTKKHRVFLDAGHEELAFLCQGQQTLVPPSRHKSGTNYYWVDGRSPKEIDIADCPQWIIDLVKSDNQTEEIQYSEKVQHSEWFTEHHEGDRSNAMARLVGSLCSKASIPKDIVLDTALNRNRLINKPPLPDEDIVKMVDSIYASELTKLEDKRSKNSDGADAAAIAQAFWDFSISEGVHYRYMQSRDLMYVTYLSNGPWKIAHPFDIEHSVNVYLNTEGFDNTQSLRNEIVTQLKSISKGRHGDGEWLDAAKQKGDSFVCENGVVNLITGAFRAWNPEVDKHVNAISALWNHEGDDREYATKFWQETLLDWLDDPESVMFLQEYIGYALTNRTDLRTAVFLTGKGSNGKSLFIDVVRELFNGNFAIMQPSEMSERFSTLSLVDKQLVICSDIDSTYLKQTGRLKQFIAGDVMSAEVKGGARFEFTPIGKMIFSANELPKTADKTDGWYSRMRIVSFNKQYAPNPEFTQKLHDTMGSKAGKSALLQWAWEGYQRLITQNRFTESGTMRRDQQEYRVGNDAVLGFLDEVIEQGVTAEPLALETLYPAFEEWCKDSGERANAKNLFISRLTKATNARRELIGNTYSMVADGYRLKAGSPYADMVVKLFNNHPAQKNAK